MLVLPRATWLAGIVPASLVAVATLLCGVWTIHVLLALYLEYKARLLARGRWYEVEEGDEGRIGAEDGGVGGRGRGGGDDGDREIEVELELVNAKARAKACSSSSSSLAAAAAEEAELEPPPVPPPPPPRERKRLRVTQYHDVAGELGGPRCRALVVALTALTLFGVGVAQVLACSSNFYYISGKAVASASLEQRAAAAMAGDSSTLQLHARSKRDWALIWGLPMCLLLLVPGYRSSRFFSVLAIAGTTFTAWYVVAASAEELNRRKGESDPTLASSYAPPNLWPRSPRGFFVGGSVIMSALGAHTICMEVFEMLRQPVRFTSAFVLAQGYVWTLVAPQALAANVAFSRGIASVDTVYGERGGKRELKRERKKRERRGREEVLDPFFFLNLDRGKKIIKKNANNKTRSPPLPGLEDARLRLAHERAPGPRLRIHPHAAVLLRRAGFRSPRSPFRPGEGRRPSARRRRGHARRDGLPLLRRLQRALRRHRGAQPLVHDPVLPLQQDVPVFEGGKRRQRRGKSFFVVLSFFAAAALGPGSGRARGGAPPSADALRPPLGRLGLEARVRS